MLAQRLIYIISLILLCWTVVRISGHSGGLNGSFQAKKSLKHRIKYTVKAILYYSNATCTFRIELIQDGDIHPNPGPCPQAKAASKQRAESAVECSMDFQQKLNKSQALYAPTELRWIQHCGSVPTLVSPDVWSTIRSLGIASRSPTHRGTKGGRRIQRRKGTTRSTTLSPAICVTKRQEHQQPKCHESHFALWNARSIKNKTHLICDLTAAEHVDIFALTETWLSGDARDDHSLADLSSSLPSISSLSSK